MHRMFITVRLAFRNLLLHKMRSFLTVLGLIFGVSSVIAMLAIAEGASLEAQKQIAELGANNVIVRSTKPLDEVNPSRQSNESFVFKFGLSYKDFDRIKETLPSVVDAIPVREFRRNIRHLDHEIEARIVAVNPDYFNLASQTAAQGRLISDADLYYFSNVAVIGSEVAEKLFPYGDPIDQSVRIGEKHFYRIIGVTESRTSSATGATPSSTTSQEFTAQDSNKDVYIPLTTDRARFGETLINEKQGNFTAEKVQLSQITVTIDAMENVKRSAEALESMLRQFHPKRDFTLTVPLELLEKAEATKRIFNLVLGSIASISLLVGGIGIMNIMLATVSERTREIGIRRAIGAKRRDIINQFLVETTVISSIGGLIGVILGVATPPLVGYLSGMPVVVRPWAPLIAFLIAVSTGLVFGVYPARRAARLHPVQALRSE